MKRLLSAFVCICLVGGMSLRAGAADTQPKPPAPGEVPPAYCGIYSLYAAALREGVDADFTTYLKTSYVHCSKGSSLEDLQLAVKDHGLYSLPMSNMTAEFLPMAGHPVILWVRGQLGSPDYNHFILYLGQSGDKWKILDAGRDIQLMSKPQLQAIWSGVGIIVSAKPIEITNLAQASLGGFGPWAAGLVLVILVAKVFGSKLATPKIIFVRIAQNPAAQALVIVAVTVGVALGYHVTAPAGLLADGSYVRDMESANLPSFIPKISRDQAKQFLAGGKATFIDARLSDDYVAGHIDGAISVPINATDENRRSIVASLSKDHPLVVYCESSGCAYAKSIGAELVRDGFTNVNLYTDGWRGWNAGTANH